MNGNFHSPPTLATSMRWFLAGLCITLNLAMAQPSEVKKETFEDYLRRRNVTFVVRGKVVDQDGAPVRDVTVDISRMTMAGPLASTEAKEVRTVDAAFDMQFQDNCAVYLSFRLAGYHSGGLSFSSLESEGVRIDGRTRIYEDITVVLQKIGKLAYLQEYGPVLKCDLDGNLRLWDISGIGTERTQTKCVDSPHVPGPDARCVYLHIAKSDNPLGPVALDGRGLELAPREGIAQLVLQDGQGGGFVRTEARGNTLSQAVLDITTAPTDGFLPTLDLTPHDIASIRAGRNLYFYFRLNGFYGKGRIASLFYRPTKGIERCRVNFFLQPDGSTNVETTSW